MNVTMVDPPMGWKYGFPRALPKRLEIDSNIKEVQAWMVEEGYPQEVIDAHGDYFPIRFWETEVEEVCCESHGGPVGLHCNHDHCTGPKLVEKE